MTDARAESYAALDRLVHRHAHDVLYRLGLHEVCARLRAVPPLVTFEAIRQAAQPVGDALRAAYAHRSPIAGQFDDARDKAYAAVGGASPFDHADPRYDSPAWVDYRLTAEARRDFSYGTPVSDDFRESAHNIPAYRDADSVAYGALAIVNGGEYDLAKLKRAVDAKIAEQIDACRELAQLRKEADETARAREAMGIGETAGAR